MKKLLCIVLTLFLAFRSKAQPERLHFELLSVGESGEKPPFQVSKCRFYVSGLQGWDPQSGWIPLSSVPVLVDLLDSSRNQISLKSVSRPLEKLRFRIGIDSAIQVLGVQGGDLDPMEGMYWSWLSGYIHFKWEARFSDGRWWEWHLGGYQKSARFYPEVELSLPKNKDTVCIQFLSGEWQNQFATEFPLRIMSPGDKAAHLEKYFQQAFKIVSK